MKHLLALALYVVLVSAGGAFAQPVTLTVHDHPSGDGPVDRVSNGVPFAPGALFDDINLTLKDGTTEVPIATRVLARWHGDNSIRSALVQFNSTFVGTTKTYSLEINLTRTMTDTLTPVTWDFPKKILTLPPDYLCTSLVVREQEPYGTTAFSAWEQKQVDNFVRIDYDAATLGSCANSDQYYNSIHSSYQMYARSGDKKYLINGRKWAMHHARDQIYLTGPQTGHGICSSWQKTRYTYTQGLVDDYFLWGSDESKDVAGLIADNFYMTHSDFYYYLAPGERGFWTEREPAFALLGLLAYYEATNDVTYLNKATQRVDSLYQMQADNGGTAWTHNLKDHDPDECSNSNAYGVSPWMTGLLLEGIIRYHQLTGSTVAEQSIIWALDYLANNCLATGNYAGESFVYMYGCGHTDGIPDTDGHISHAFAFGFVMTGNTAYRDIALDIIDTNVTYGYVGTTKHYNQQFRASGHAVAYLMDDVVASAWNPPPARVVELEQNYPNPFNPATTIAYAIDTPGRVRIGIYDVSGRLVRVLVDKPYAAAGRYAEPWDGLNQAGSPAASGVYVVRLESAGQVRTKKIVLVK